MRICFIADDQSPIAASWIQHLADRGHEAYIIPTRGPVPATAADALRVPPAIRGGSDATPAARAQAAGLGGKLARAVQSELRGGLLLSGIAIAGSGVAGLASTMARVASVRRLVDAIAPDVVHAMRIPFEGILAALAVRRGVPLVLSVWGNDFTLHARSNPVVAALTRHALRRADALHADCSRDLRLAFDLGFDARRPAVALPGSGGVNELFLRAGVSRAANLADTSPVVINPRGLRPYIRNDAFFQAIPLVLQRLPTTRFVCTGMQGEAVAERWVEKLGIRSAVELLPVLSTANLAACFARADVSVSPSVHDGTPNTLLESMAAGAFPVAGILESVREWITHERNGLLCDPVNPESLASAIIQAVEDTDLRMRARILNRRLIDERARYRVVMPQALAFYERVVRRDGYGAEAALRRSQVPSL